MGAKTKQVGGGSATGLADDWNGFLRQQLNNSQQPQMQSQSGFQGAFNNALSGQVQDNSGSGAALQNFFQNPTGQNAPTNFGNQYSGPQFQGANLSSLPTNFGQGQTGMADLSGFGNAAQSNFNSQGPINSQFTGQLNGLMNQGGNLMNSGGGFSAAQIGAAPQLQGGMDYATANATLGQDPLLARVTDRNAADLRARYGAEGIGSLGTGSQFAEGNMRAELAAQDASNRRGQSMQLMGQDLNERMGRANVSLQGRGQDANVAVANMQGGLQGNQNMNNTFGQMLGAAGQARGQDLSTALGQLGLGNQQSMFNAGQANDMQSQMLQGTLQNQNLGNQFGVNSAQINNAAMQNNNLNSLNNTQFQNQFNQNNSQLGAQFGQAANQLNSQNQAQNNDFFAQMMNQGNQMNGMGNQNMMNMLQMMFGANQQANALGTPQAQMIQQPSGWGQALNAGLGLAGSALGGPLGGMIGSKLGGMFGGGSAALPVGIGQGALPQSMGNFQMPGMPNMSDYGFPPQR